MDGPTGADLAAAVARRQREVVAAVGALDEAELHLPTRLPGWSRLTIVCHLRFGALASDRMTADTMAGRPTAYYPLGRAAQRAATLEPGDGETALDAVASLDEAGRRLDRRWAELDPDGDPERWAAEVVEPPDLPDLGSISLRTLALLRLTEVEVHGLDLDLGLSPWSTTFVEAALPHRLLGLARRRSNHRPVDRSVVGSWALVSDDGPGFLIDVGGPDDPDVRVERIEGSAPPDRAAATIAGSSAELLAFILGRRSADELRLGRDLDLARSFLQAFPAP